MIHHIRLENDEATYTLLLEDDFGSYHFHVDPDMLLEALAGYIAHLAEGTAVRQQYVASGGVSWAEARRESWALGREYVCPDPEGDWIEEQRHQADVLRKRNREEAA